MERDLREWIFRSRNGFVAGESRPSISTMTVGSISRLLVSATPAGTGEIMLLRNLGDGHFS